MQMCVFEARHIHCGDKQTAPWENHLVSLQKKKTVIVSNQSKGRGMSCKQRSRCYAAPMRKYVELHPLNQPWITDLDE